jgi:glycosyltransferase involved in cell wall biosynthesis
VTARQLWLWYRPFGLGGVESYLLNMARQAVGHGARVWVAATDAASGPLRAEFERAGVQIVDWSAYHAAFMSGRGQQQAQCMIARDLLDIQPDLIALNDCNEFSIGMSPLLAHARKSAIVLDTLHIDSPAPEYLEFRRHFVQHVDGVACTNANVLGRFLREYPAHPPSRARYIPNGVPVVAQAHAAPGGVLKLLYVGRLVQDQKRILELPALLAALATRGRDFLATIAGDGPQRAELESRLQSHGLAGKVRLTGYLEPAQVQQAMLEHDALVNISSFEGFSISVLEALACGCVPLCTDVAGLDHTVLRDGVNCRLVPVDAPQQLVDVCAQLDAPAISSMSARARETSQAHSDVVMYRAYEQFARALAAARELQPWPKSFPSERWDMTRHNPWSPRARWPQRLARRVMHAISRTCAPAR